MNVHENSRINVISISSVPIMSSGGVKGVGMISIFAFHRELAKKGYNVTYLQCSPPKQRELVVDCEGVTTYCIDTVGLPKILERVRIIRKILGLPLWVVSAVIPAYRYLRQIQQGGISMVLYGQQASGAVLASIMSYLLKVPNVTRLYGSLLPFHLGMSPHYPVGTLRKLLNFLFHWEECLGMLAPADAFILTNDGTYLDVLVRKLKGRNVRILHPRNGIELNWAAWLAKGRERSIVTRFFGNEAPVVLTAGRFERWKRIDRVINIAGFLHTKGELVNFLILGNGREEHNLLQQIRRLGIGDRVQIHPAVSQEEMPDYLMAADVILSVQDYSNLTNTLMEALVLERPVVTIDVGGIDDVMRNAENCVLVNLEKVIEEASDTIIRILQDATLRERLANGAKKWKVEHAYTWGERVNVDVNLINSLCAEDSHPNLLRA